MSNVEVKKERAINLPQANNFDSLVSMLFIMNSKRKTTNKDLQASLEWNEREVNYYLQAAQLLNLVEASKVSKEFVYTLTFKTKAVFKKDKRDIILYLIRRVSDTYPVSKQMVDHYLKTGHFLEKSKITTFVANNKNDNNLSHETLLRRISTLNSWSKWIVSNIRQVY